MTTRKLETLSVSFTTATGFDGFQAESITSPGAPVLFTESFGTCTADYQLALKHLQQQGVQRVAMEAMAAGTAVVAAN